MNRDQMPLPRFWYFPRGEKAVVVMTGDDHGAGGTDRPVRLGQLREPGRLRRSRTGSASAAPRTCTPARRSPTRCRGATRPRASRSPSTSTRTAPTGRPRRSTASTTTSWRTSRAAFPSVPAPSTNRTHCITWSDWATQPKVELDHGIRLDTNYYYWPAAWVQDRPGYFTGSGMPMRFADLDGSLIDVYQAATQMTDESGMTYSTHINTLLDNAIGAPGYYGAFTANMHTDNGNHPGQQTVVAAPWPGACRWCRRARC